VNVHVRPLALRAIPKNAPSGSTAKFVGSPLSAVPPLVPLPGALRRTEYRLRPRYLSPSLSHDLVRKGCDLSASCH
jgi:hypothetical protein